MVKRGFVGVPPEQTGASCHVLPDVNEMTLNRSRLFHFSIKTNRRGGSGPITLSEAELMEKAETTETTLSEGGTDEEVTTVVTRVMADDDDVPIAKGSIKSWLHNQFSKSIPIFQFFFNLNYSPAIYASPAQSQRLD